MRGLRPDFLRLLRQPLPKMCLAMAACLLWPGFAHAAWLEASGEHFVIYADDREQDITRFATQLESYHAAMATVLASDLPPPSPSNRVTVFVVRGEREVRSLYGDKKSNVAGFYVPRAGASVAIVPAVQAGKGEIAFSMVVLLHEYAHHFLMSMNSSERPRWFNEGAAEFFASSRFDSDGSVWLGRPAQHRAGELYMSEDVTATELLDPAAYEKKHKDDDDAFYGKSWLLYHYLTFKDERKGQLTAYLNALDAGSDQVEAAGKAFGDFGVLERNLQTYLRANRMSALKLTPAILKVSPVKVRTLSAGEAAMMPVRIKSQRGVSSKEAANEVLAMARQIAATYPGDAAVQTALAECEFDAGNDKEAIAAADAALAIDRNQVNAYIQKGYALFDIAEHADDRDAAYKAARAPFVALNRIENDHPIPLMYFFRSYVLQGKTPPPIAIDGLIRAVQVAPFDQGLRMTLGHALLRTKRSAEARIVLQPVASNPHQSGLSKTARAMIDRIDKDPDWNGEGVETAGATS